VFHIFRLQLRQFLSFPHRDRGSGFLNLRHTGSLGTLRRGDRLLTRHRCLASRRGLHKASRTGHWRFSKAPTRRKGSLPHHRSGLSPVSGRGSCTHEAHPGWLALRRPSGGEVPPVHFGSGSSERLDSCRGIPFAHASPSAALDHFFCDLACFTPVPLRDLGTFGDSSCVVFLLLSLRGLFLRLGNRRGRGSSRLVLSFSLFVFGYLRLHYFLVRPFGSYFDLATVSALLVVTFSIGNGLVRRERVLLRALVFGLFDKLVDLGLAVCH